MSAEGILDDPALYFEAAATRQELLEASHSAVTATEGAAAQKNCADGDKFVLSRLPAPASGLATSEARKPSRLELAMEYLKICERHPVKQRQDEL